jgi:hypothetical protein
MLRPTPAERQRQQGRLTVTWLRCGRPRLARWPISVATVPPGEQSDAPGEREERLHPPEPRELAGLTGGQGSCYP